MQNKMNEIAPSGLSYFPFIFVQYLCIYFLLSFTTNILQYANVIEDVGNKKKSFIFKTRNNNKKDKTD